ncbi:MAG: endonuclease/exonuclease/phosphatase family protein [Bacteroidetes bacterium]|nr:MAG: endonuclease/exonuclease/phosphatase family protein [Bacteroidota bacterium]
MRISFWVLMMVGLMAMSCRSTSESDQNTPRRAGDRGLMIGFYNVENLFDAEDDPDRDDSEFLPGGRYDWTEEKYAQKLENIADAIAAMGTQGPDVLGLAEVENMHVLEDLVKQPALAARGYAIVHEESPDMRGIDVALIYDPSRFRYTGYETFKLTFPTEPDYTSRPILVVHGEVKGEALHVLVNHWPSRYGGQAESESRRLVAAEKVAEICANLRRQEADPAIVIMGDFNDDPFNKGLAEVLQGAATPEAVTETGCFNPMYALHDPESRGTLTYQGKWNLFDQILVNADLIDSDGRLYYVEGSATIHGPEFMQVGGDGAAKDMPRRAIYRGEFQPEGFSDHFPVYLRLGVR